MHRGDVFVGKGARLALGKEPARHQGLQDAAYPHGRLHIATVVHMVDLVLGVHHQGDLLQGAAFNGRAHRLGFDVAKGAQLNGIIPKRGHDFLYITRRTVLGVFAFQDGPHHLAHKSGPQGFRAVQSVIHQMGHAGIAVLDRHLIIRADDRPGAVALVKLQTGAVLFDDGLILAGLGIIGQTLEKKALDIQGHGFDPHAVIQRTAQPTAGGAFGSSDPVQEAKTDHGLVQHHGKSLHPVPQILGHQQTRAEALFERVAQFFADLIYLFGGRLGKTGAQDLLYLFQRFPVDRQHIVVNSADFQHDELS